MLLLAIILSTAAETGAVRLTETSITEVGKIDGAQNFKMKTKGYGIGYVDSTGFGGHICALTTSGKDDVATGYSSVELKHTYLDASYTEGLFADKLLITGGFGVGISGRATAVDQNGTHHYGDFSSKDLFLGPGFSVGWFEAYWIHRRNYMHFANSSNPAISMQSRHYQLGLGFRF